MKQSAQLSTEEVKEYARWNRLMFSCRKACNILHIDFKEPMYLDWKAGREYYRNLWEEVKRKRKS